MKYFSFLFMLAATVGAPILSRADVVDGIKAVVAQRVITFGEVEDITRPAADALRRQYTGNPDLFQQKLNEALNDSLELLVERALILTSFDRDGYHLPESYVDQIVQDRIRDRFGDRVTMMKSLQQQGMTYEEFRKQVRDQYIESAMRSQNVQREIIVSPFKIQNYYTTHLDQFKVEDQVKLRMIVLGKTSDADTNALATALEILAKLKDGADFAQMATLYSQSSDQHPGGDWGWEEPSKLRAELAGPAATLKPGEISEPIVAGDSIYLMQVVEKKPAHAQPLADVRSEIEKTLRTQQQAQLQKKWMDGLKKKTFVRYF